MNLLKVNVLKFSDPYGISRTKYLHHFVYCSFRMNTQTQKENFIDMCLQIHLKFIYSKISYSPRNKIRKSSCHKIIIFF